MGPIYHVGLDFISELGHWISALSEDPREISFLFQLLLPVAEQRSNAACLLHQLVQPPFGRIRSCTEARPEIPLLHFHSLFLPFGMKNRGKF